MTDLNPMPTAAMPPSAKTQKWSPFAGLSKPAKAGHQAKMGKALKKLKKAMGQTVKHN